MTLPLVLAAAPLSSWLSDGLNARYALCDCAAALSAGRAGEATVLVTTAVHGVDTATLEQLPNLRLIAIHGVGYDRVDVAYAAARGIAVTTTPDILTEDVADMAVALLLATARRIAANDRFVRAGDWHAGAAVPLGRKVSGARFGILGLGRIGQAIARRLEGFGGAIGYHNRRPVAGSAYRYHASAEALAAASDVLIVATSGGAEASHIVDRAVIAALGPDGILINVGRGANVDEAALIAALEAGGLAGAGLDVFATEPDVPAALRALDQVVLQPHQASATVQTRRAMAELVIANVAASLEGRPLPTPLALPG